MLHLLLLTTTYYYYYYYYYFLYYCYTDYYLLLLLLPFLRESWPRWGSSSQGFSVQASELWVAVPSEHRMTCRASLCSLHG